ncbi:hypothetical protein V501_01382 [Pseudogymnoascus sp. VKM F-4519 (FW-2642)]|nr:hypothetical protein V501_01382 [Pseudogymnoascus sp. VKM F-4519 (FW-2642)]
MMATIKAASTPVIFPGRTPSQLVAYTYHTSAGRDKLLRTVQNIAGFAAWGLQRSPANKQRLLPLIVSLTLVKKHLRLTAKLTRGSGIIALFHFAATAAKNQEKDKVLKHLLVGKLLSQGVFATLDFLCYNDAVGIVTLPNVAAVQRKAYKAWLCGVIFSTISTLYSLVEIWRRQNYTAEINGQAAENISKE